MWVGAGTDDQLNIGNNDTIGEQVIVKTGAGDDVVNLQGTAGDDGTNALIDFGPGIGADHETGLGNELDVYSDGTATLEPLDGNTGSVVVDTVNLSGSGGSNYGALIAADQVNIGALQFEDHGSATVNASSTVASCELHSAGELAITTASTFGTLTVDSGASLDFATSCDIGTLEIDCSAEFEAPMTIGSLDVNGYAIFTGDSATTSIDTLNLNGTMELYPDADVTADTMNVNLQRQNLSVR